MGEADSPLQPPLRRHWVCDIEACSELCVQKRVTRSVWLNLQLFVHQQRGPVLKGAVHCLLQTTEGSLQMASVDLSIPPNALSETNSCRR